MFTGLIQEVGKIQNIKKTSSGKEFELSCPNLYEELKVGDSLSINGACQTITQMNKNTVCFQSVWATLEKTNLSWLKSGAEVNLELALKMSERLGGHFVQGHVNTMATVETIDNKGQNYLLKVRFPGEFKKYFVREGSIALDGISLTIYDIDDSRETLSVSIITHTWDVTNLKNLKVGQKLNVEVDLLAKYVEKMLISERNQGKSLEWYKEKLI